MVLFFVGMVEMMIAAAWTKAVSTTKVLASGAITMVNIFIWYYVLRIVIDDISNWQVIFIYAAGCAIGTILTTFLFSVKEKRGKIRRRQKRPLKVEYDNEHDHARGPRWA